MEAILNYIPVRDKKPRNTGITIITDTGLSTSEIESLHSVSGSIIDFVKIGVAALLTDLPLKERFRLYKNVGAQLLLSGTLFEASYLRNNLDEYNAFIKDHEFDAVEISNSIINISTGEKCEIIQRLSSDFKVFSELGNKQNRTRASSEVWKTNLKTDLEAGAWKIILEGGENGRAYLYNDLGEPSENRINSIASRGDLKNIIWEAPMRFQQEWFVNKFGLDVNLANIRPGDLSRLESLRIGLHSETFSAGIPASLLEGRIKTVDPLYNLDIQI
ncbi:MAG: phosphosulfolactate synthase [Bacteroidales bacterium]